MCCESEKNAARRSFCPGGVNRPYLLVVPAYTIAHFAQFSNRDLTKSCRHTACLVKAMNVAAAAALVFDLAKFGASGRRSSTRLILPRTRFVHDQRLVVK